MTHRRITALLLLCATTGCSTWRATSVPAATAPSAAPRPVRFVRAGVDTVILERAVVLGDSLVGWQGRRRVATPLTDVQQLETARVDVRRTLKGAAIVYGAMLFSSALLLLYLFMDT